MMCRCSRQEPHCSCGLCGSFGPDHMDAEMKSETFHYVAGVAYYMFWLTCPWSPLTSKSDTRGLGRVSLFEVYGPWPSCRIWVWEHVEIINSGWQILSWKCNCHRVINSVWTFLDTRSPLKLQWPQMAKHQLGQSWRRWRNQSAQVSTRFSSASDPYFHLCMSD